MASTILKILDEFNLIHSKGRVEKIAHLDDDEIDLVLLAFDDFYRNQVVSSQNLGSTDIWLPFTSSEEILKDSSSYFLVFDRVILLDPLYDYICTLRNQPDIRDLKTTISILDSSPNIPVWFKNGIFSSKTKSYYSKAQIRLRNHEAQKIDRIIDFYIKQKDLIEEHVLIPHIDMSSNFAQYVPDFFPLTMDLIRHFTTHGGINLPKENISEEDTQELVTNLLSLMIVDNAEIWRFLTTSLELKSTLISNGSSHLTLGEEKNKVILNQSIELAAKTFGDKFCNFKEIKWPTEEDELVFESMKGLQGAEIMKIRAKEKDAFDKFRYETQKKLIELKSTASNTEEYHKLLKSFDLDHKKQVSELSLVFSQIKREYSRKFAYQLASVTLGAGAAILAASASLNDPLAMIGVGMASSSTVAGLLKFTETWIDYQTEKEKLKEKDGYILWRMRNK